MAILNQKRILNLIPKVSAPVTIHVSQGDVGTEIEFTLVKGDEVFSNTGNLTASVHGVREDGANFGPFTCTLSGSKVTFPLHSEMTAVKGSALTEIVLVDNSGNKVGSANFGILVEESVFPLGVTYDNDMSVYESILAYVQTIPAQITNDYTAKINAVQSNLNNEITTRTSADALINTRIDEIIAPTGEAPNPAEIVDARIGADGVTYDTLGTAIRTQVSNLKTDCSTLFDVLNGKSSFINVVNASVDINNNGILEYGHPDRLTTKDIIELDYPFVVKINERYAGWIAYYDDNDNFISWENFPPTGNELSRFVDAGKRFRIILRVRGTSDPISIEEYKNLTITNREFFYDYVAAFSNYCEGSYSYRSIYSFDDIDKIVFAGVNNSGVTKTRGRLTTSDIRTAETSLIIKAREGYNRNSWIAYYDNPSDVAYSSWSYIRDTVIIPEGAHYRIIVVANPERDMEAYEAFSSIYIQSPIESIISSEYLKVCSFNVGKWFDGVTDGVPDSDVNEYVIRWHKLLGANNADILIMQEAIQYFDRSATIDPYEAILKHKYPYKYNVGFSTSYSASIKQMMIASKIPLINPTAHEFGNGDARGYITFSVDVGKNVINFIATHLSIEANSSGVRQTEISTLANLMDSYENVVLAGDMNLYSLSELDPFRNAGYELSNDGLFGQYNTWPHGRETWPNECIDNIITKNLAIQNVYMGNVEDATGNTPLSDHVPLYTEIKMT